MTGINDLGQVISESTISFGEVDGQPILARQAFRTVPSSPIDITTDNVGGGQGEATANGINNLSQLVGTVGTFSASTVSYGTSPNGYVSDLGSTLGILTATDINDASQVSARSIVNRDLLIFYAVRIDEPNNNAASQIDLGTLGGTESAGNAINNLGQVVGSSETANGETHAFRTVANSVINAATDDLGTLGGSSSTAFDINDLGQFVGSSTITSGATHAFVTDANSAI